MSENRFYVGDRIGVHKFGAYLSGEIVFVDEEVVDIDSAPYLVLVDNGMKVDDPFTPWIGADLKKDSALGHLVQDVDLIPDGLYSWIYGCEAILLEGPAYKKIPTTFLEGVDI